MDITCGKLTKRKKFRLLLLRKLKRANHRYEFPRFSGEMDRLPNLFSSFQAQRGLCHDRSYFFCQWNCTIGSGNWNVRLCSNCRCVQSWKWFISNGTAGTTGIGNSMPSPASFRLNQSSWSFDSVLFESCRRLNILKSRLSRTPEKLRIFYLGEQYKEVWIHVEW